MKFYPQDVARDFLYPINKKDVSKLYKIALNDLFIENNVIHGYSGYFRISKKIYGNLTGLHLREHNGYLEISVPTIFLVDNGYQSLRSLINKRTPEKLLFHKRKHLSKNPGFIVGDTFIGSIPVPDVIERVVVKRMIIKLGGVKMSNIVLFDFPYF